MKNMQCYKTIDGSIHPTYERALKHAEVRYGDALTKLAHAAVRIEKYSGMCQFIEDNLLDFASLVLLKYDMKVSPPDADED